ncbi:MAG: hypothetical protein OXH65_00825 [Paracoccaceae bacterium]|nr:hypothetical protein [Paracoccaceae bacterium]MDE2673633.1 hypothetical protein [Paracoccaceae bacterium]MXZ50262.1 hypothetical protein [Paracoccaceae bacterium]MYF44973.1 hypothetical protein [Paracoccaceae bacterium]MYG09866.1 hypothetical protein [Paracoccaceae bacterium]
MKLILVAAIPVLLAMSTQVLGDWAYDMTSEKCSDESRRLLAESTRNQIEYSVRRAEASIDAPTPVGDLGCLAGLMQLPLGTFASTGNLGGIFNNSLNSLVNSNGNIINQYCARAEREWRKATRSLGRNNNSYNKFVLPSYFSTRMTKTETDQANTPTDPVVSEANAPTAGGTSFSAQQTLVTPQVSSGQDTQMEVPLDEDQSIEGIWDTIYGKESNQ